MKVLVTDAEVRHSLAVIRSLGSSGMEVTACSHRPRCQGFYSRYCERAVVLPGGSHPDFIPRIEEEIREQEVDVFLPVGDRSSLAVAEGGARIRKICSTAISKPEIYGIAADKGKTLELAAKLGIPIPTKPGENDPYPRVVKPATGGKARYVEDQRQLDRALADMPGAMVQEFVPGSQNYSVCALMDNGRPLAVFTHRELRELPPTGGSATLAESIAPNEVTTMGLKMLKHLGWHGIAMAEFKKDDRDGGYKLMEINPRFWASLELAIACGIDFPILTARLATGEELEPVENYRVGVKFRWLAQDILQLSMNRGSLPVFLTDFFNPKIRYEIAVNDVKPHIYELLNSLAWSLEIGLGKHIEPRIA